MMARTTAADTEQSQGQDSCEGPPEWGASMSENFQVLQNPCAVLKSFRSRDCRPTGPAHALSKMYALL